MPIVRQTSFAAGEFSPGLYGRSDLEKYHAGLKRCRNFFISQQGQAVSRPGTTYVNEVKSSTAGAVRLIPFVYSDTVSFVLEFGNLYVRFYTNGSVVLSGGVPLEAVTPYLTADLPKLKYAQQGAVLTLAHGNYPPAELTYAGGTSWSYAAINFARSVATAGSNLFVQSPVLPGVKTITLASIWSAVPTYGMDDWVVYNGKTYRSISRSNTNNQPDTATAYWVADDTNLAREWVYKITELWKDSRGNEYETAPATLLQGVQYYQPWNSRVTYQKTGQPQGGAKVLSTTKDSATGVSDGGTVNHVYQSLVDNNKNNLLSDATKWSDLGTTVTGSPAQTDTMPASFALYPDTPVTISLNASYASALTDANFLGWRVYRGSGALFGWVGDLKFATGGTFTDFGVEPDYTRVPPQGLNPFKFYNADGTLNHTEYPSAVAFFEGRRCFARSDQRPSFTWMSVVEDYANFDSRLIPVPDEALSFEIASRRLEEIRALVPLGPKLLQGTNSAFWATSGSGGPISFDNIDAKRQGEVGTSWVDPLVVDGTVLFVRAKGTGVRSLTEDYVRQSQVSSDVSLLSSHLFIGHQIVDWAYSEDPWSMVLAAREDGVLLTFTYVKDHDVWAWARHDTDGLVENVCSVPEGLGDAVYLVVNRTIGNSTKRYIERVANRVVTATNGNQMVCLDCSGVYNGTATTNITGLTWLAGKTVYVLADGNVQGPFTVSGTGVVTLTSAAAYVIVGLVYTPELQMLDVAMSGIETKTLDKIVNRVGFEVDNSRGLAVGADFDNLTEWAQRSVADAYGAIPLTSKLVRQWILGSWGTDGDVCLRQTWPLPVTVLAIAREVQLVPS